jgi:hypothetical protein
MCLHAGGFNGQLRTSSGEKYNPEDNTWSPIPDMLHARSNIATAVIDDRIFAVGGYDGVNSTRYVEYFDENSNQWFVYS